MTADRCKTPRIPHPLDYRGLDSPSPITISSLKDGKHIEVNKSFLDITGYKAEEVIGHTAPELN
ncbi:MAG: PAS domain S-box protein, partial [Moorea sp. SIO2B7]|nr:PAS domain S-box protein [Moorena sp. SIO2B7]